MAIVDDILATGDYGNNWLFLKLTLARYILKDVLVKRISSGFPR